MAQNSREFCELLDDPAIWDRIDDAASGCADATLGGGDPNFLFGVATSTFQDSGAYHCPQSQWTEWEKKCLGDDARSERAVDLFKLYCEAPNEVIERLKLLKVNTYRFSVEWSQIEPEAGFFNEEVLERYVNFCKALRDNGIHPFITLHHFSEPLWFHRLGSFEKGENIAFFAAFCAKVFGALIQEYGSGPLVDYFCTINEPNIEAFSRYILGTFSPGFRCRIRRGATFLLHMLKAHSLVYKQLKGIAFQRGVDDIKIGITHQYLRFIPTHLLAKPLTAIFNEFNEATLSFFRKGVFDFNVPIFCHLREEGFDGRTDFVGVQFYSRVYVGWRGVQDRGKEPTAMLGIYEDPEGLYEAIVTVFDAFKVPVIVSESGIAAHSEEQRARFLRRVIYAAERARQTIGPNNMLGYILWSFCDNFEWFLGWKPTFGAYALTTERQLQRSYKPGVQPFIDAIDAWQASLPRTSTPLVPSY